MTYSRSAVLRRVSVLLFLCSAVLGSRCGDTIINNQLPTSPTSSTPSTPSINKIEYRVSGNAVSSRIRYSNEQDGLIQTQTTLPFFTTFGTTSNTVFVSLEVTPIAYPAIVVFPFLEAQIFVNGDLFREASSNDFTLQTISTNGTWRNLTPAPVK